MYNVIKLYSKKKYQLQSHIIRKLPYYKHFTVYFLLIIIHLKILAVGLVYARFLAHTRGLNFHCTSLFILYIYYTSIKQQLYIALSRIHMDSDRLVP